MVDWISSADDSRRNRSVANAHIEPSVDRIPFLADQSSGQQVITSNVTSTIVLQDDRTVGMEFGA
jgi:hypothetical protein